MLRTACLGGLDSGLNIQTIFECSYLIDREAMLTMFKVSEDMLECLTSY